jgi:hypothetical protein
MMLLLALALLPQGEKGGSQGAYATFTVTECRAAGAVFVPFLFALYAMLGISGGFVHRLDRRAVPHGVGVFPALCIMLRIDHI